MDTEPSRSLGLPESILADHFKTYQAIDMQPQLRSDEHQQPADGILRTLTST